MNLRDLLALYALVGLACAIAVYRKGATVDGARAALLSALATVPLWPLWAPFVLATPGTKPRTRSTSPVPGPEARPDSRLEPRSESRPAGNPARYDVTSQEPPTQGRRGPLPRIETALEESVRAVAGTPMSTMFSRDVAARIAEEVRLVAARMRELGTLAHAQGLDREASLARLLELERAGAPERTLATARQKHESLLRLEQLRAADAGALEELADLLEALRAQLLVARYAGSSADGTGAIVSEVWARLEGLGGAFEVGSGDGGGHPVGADASGASTHH